MKTAFLISMAALILTGAAVLNAQEQTTETDTTAYTGTGSAVQVAALDRNAITDPTWIAPVAVAQQDSLIDVRAGLALDRKNNMENVGNLLGFALPVIAFAVMFIPLY